MYRDPETLTMIMTGILKDRWRLAVCALGILTATLTMPLTVLLKNSETNVGVR